MITSDLMSRRVSEMRFPNLKSQPVVSKRRYAEGACHDEPWSTGP
jgi:hypothetical protein